MRKHIFIYKLLIWCHFATTPHYFSGSDWEMLTRILRTALERCSRLDAWEPYSPEGCCSAHVHFWYSKCTCRFTQVNHSHVNPLKQPPRMRFFKPSALTNYKWSTKTQNLNKTYIHITHYCV